MVWNPFSDFWESYKRISRKSRALFGFLLMGSGVFGLQVIAPWMEEMQRKRQELIEEERREIAEFNKIREERRLRQQEEEKHS